MARIRKYPIDATPTISDKLIGTDVDNEDITMNYTIGDTIGLVPVTKTVQLTSANGNVYQLVVSNSGTLSTVAIV